jgi:predicted N-formylglutamate amidohydrolase
VVARYATPEEWAEVAALRDEVGALEAALAEAEALAEAVRVWANDPYRPDESAEQYMDRVGQLREDGILDALREFDARRAATAGQEG